MSIALTKADGPVPRGGMFVVSGHGWCDDPPRLTIGRVPDGPITVPSEPNELPSMDPAPACIEQQQEHVLTLSLPDEPFGVFAVCADVDEFILVNQARLEWLSARRAEPGDTVRAFGRALVSLDLYPRGDAEGNPVSFGGDVDGQTRIVLEDSAGAFHTAEVLRTSSYDVEFRVPEMPTGPAKVFAHNGHGGDLGWSQPVAIEIRETDQWPQDTFPVDQFGAAGNGFEDDGPAIQAALDCARENGGGIVYFPAGGYHFNQTLWVPPWTVLKGESRERCWLYMPDGFGPNARDASVPVGFAGEGAMGMEDLSVHACYCKMIMATPLLPEEPLPQKWNDFTWRQGQEHLPHKHADGSFIRRCRLLHNFTHLYHRRLNDRKFAGVGIGHPDPGDAGVGAGTGDESHGCTAFAIRGNDLEITDNECQGRGSAGTIADCSHALVARNTFHAGSKGNCFNMLVSPDVCRNIIFEDNVLSSNSQMHHSALWIMHGSQNLHVARNEIVRQFWVSDCEGLLCHIWGFGLPLYVKNASPDWIELDIPRMLAFKENYGAGERWRIENDDTLDLQKLVGNELQIQDGPGLGLYANIVAVDGNRVYLDRAWRTIPDTRSVIASFPHAAYRNCVFVDNVLEDTGPSVMIWGNGHDCVIDGNRCTRTGLLGTFAVFYPGHIGGGCHFVQIINNIMDEGRVRNFDQHDPGGRYAGGYITTFYSVMDGFIRGDGLAFVGHTVRNNLMLNDSTIRFGPQMTVAHMDQSARTDGGDKFFLSAQSGDSPHDHVGIIIERNRSRNCHHGIIVGSTVLAMLRDNEFDNVDLPLKDDSVAQTVEAVCGDSSPAAVRT